MKRTLSLLMALLMLVCLFAGCATDQAKDDGKDNSGQTDGKDPDSKDPDDGGSDVPDEADIVKITWLGTGDGINYKNAVAAEDESLRQQNAIMAKYGFEIETSWVDQEVYVSTVNSMMGAGTLTQSYSTYGRLDDNTIVQWIEAGLFLSCDEIMEYSTGNMIKAFGEDGLYDWGRAKATYTDGDWYYVLITNDPERGLQLTEEDGPLRVKVQLHGIYGLMVRQDWLDDLGLAMPQTPQEYYDACVSMRTNDANENGMSDERVIIGFGSEYQYQGIGQWYGLPYLDFFSDPSSGEVEVAMLKKGYADWATYLNQFYNSQLIASGEGGHPWEDGSTFFSQNVVISWYRQANNVWTTGRSQSGDPDCNFQPLPIIAAVEGEKARIICQEATSGEFGFSFNADTITPEDAAKLVDYVYSYEMFLLFYYGVEGKAWEYEEDGVHILDYTLDPDYRKGDIENQYMPLDAKESGTTWNGWTAYVPNARMADLWSPYAKTYDSPQEALDAGEPYAEGNSTAELWMTQNEVDYHQPNWVQLNNLNEWGMENINVAAYYDYETLPTAEEAAIQSEYANDLKTYLVETATKLVMGEYNVADLQSYIDYAYENLGLQEYIDVQQIRVDRFMDAMGL